MATSNLGFDNKFSTTLSSGITATDTTIPLTALPTASEGYLVIEPDSSTAWEEIYYTSKTGSAVVCPSVAAGRGVGGSTAATHSSGATVRCDSTAEMFESLQDATGMTGLHTYHINNLFDFVASGCIWSGDSYGSTLAASMTSGVVYINGRRHTVATITSRSFTASKDTYIDLIYSTSDNIATPVYTEVSNNATSPALAANSVRIGIVVSGGSNIANAGSVNQGQETKVLPIASSIPYQVTDSLGNLICPRDPNKKVIGYRQAITNRTGTTIAQVTELSSPIIIPTARKVKITALLPSVQNSGTGTNTATIWDGVVNSGTQLGASAAYVATATGAVNLTYSVITTLAAGSHTINIGVAGSSGTWTVVGGATAPSAVLIELA